MKRILAHRESIPALLVVVAFIVGGIASPHFLDFRYLLDETSLYVEAGLLVLGMTLVIVCGQIDLSVASMLALVAGVTAKLLAAGWSAPVAMLVGVVLGGVLGAINGILIAKLKLPSFVVTLGTMAAYRGASQVMLGSQSQKMPSNLIGIDYLKPLGIPLPLIIFLFAAAIIALLLHRTVFGRWIFTVGTNEQASFYSGVPTDRVKITVFAISGILAGVAGLLIDSRLGVARYDHARGLEVDVITAVVLGGASISGGKGSVLGSLLALILIALIRIGMGVANVTAEYQLTAVGALLILAVMFGNLAERTVAKSS